MLVMSRCKGEEILIGDDIVVRVTDIRSDKVRIGVSAPKHIAIDRREIRESKDAGDPHDGPPADTTTEPQQFMTGERGQR